MVLLLRAAGVPARIVAGFYGGEENAYGDYIIVRQNNAHSWVEASVDGRWMRFDPTPLVFPGEKSRLSLYLDSLRMSWFRYVIGYSSTDQFRLLRLLTAPSVSLPEMPGIKVNLRPIYLLGVAVVMVFVLLRLPYGRVRPGKRPVETRLYLRFRKRLKKRGGRVGKFSTPGEVKREAIALSLDGKGVSEFIRMYEETRFGGEEPDPRIEELYRELMRR
jgi:hypothetical protein